MQSDRHIDDFPHRRTRFQRVLMWLVLLLLTAQLLGMAFHKHDYADAGSDCAACTFIHHLPSNLPEVSIGLPPLMLLLVFQLACIGVYRFLPQISYLIPRSQAPPRV